MGQLATSQVVPAVRIFRFKLGNEVSAVGTGVEALGMKDGHPPALSGKDAFPGLERVWVFPGNGQVLDPANGQNVPVIGRTKKHLWEHETRHPSQ